MTRGRRIAVLVLLVSALALAASGQYYFFHRRDYLWDGVFLYGLAVLCFGLAWRQATIHGSKACLPASWLVRLGDWRPGRTAPAALMAAGLGLSCVATMLSANRTASQSTADVMAFWLFGCGAAVAAALWPSSSPGWLRSDWGAWFKGISRATWLEAATVGGLAVLALILRVSALNRVPYTLGGDEAWHGLLARQVLKGELRNPFVMGYMSMPTFFYWPLSWSLRWVGDGLVGLRVPAALAGTATVLAQYGFVRTLWGRRTAFLSAAFLAAYDYHIHYSRLGANNVWDPLFVLLTLWLVELGLGCRDEARRTRFFILAGVLMGLSTYFYTGARLLPFLVVVYVAFVWFSGRRGPDGVVETPRRGADTGLGWPMLMLALAFLVVAGPMLHYALLHPDEWNARINQVGIIQSGWLAREPGLTGKSMLRILAEQFLRAAGAFHAFSDRTVWYGADRPLLGFLAGILAILGMAWSLFHWRERRSFLLLVWFWSVIITGGMLTESPPSSQRLVMAIPVVALLVAVGLEQAVDLLGRAISPSHGVWQNAALGGLCLILALGSIHFYFVEFTPERRYGSKNGETATMIGHYLRGLDGVDQVYFFGAPRIYWGFGTMSFLAPDLSGQDVIEPLAGAPELGDPGEGAVFILLPERAGELDWVQQAYPGGTRRDWIDPSGELRFVAYQVP